MWNKQQIEQELRGQRKRLETMSGIATQVAQKQKNATYVQKMAGHSDRDAEQQKELKRLLEMSRKAHRDAEQEAKHWGVMPYLTRFRVRPAVAGESVIAGNTESLIADLLDETTRLRLAGEIKMMTPRDLQGMTETALAQRDYGTLRLIRLELSGNRDDSAKRIVKMIDGADYPERTEALSLLAEISKVFQETRRQYAYSALGKKMPERVMGRAVA